MTRNHLTKEYVNKLAAEIKRAADYLGAEDEEYIKSRIEKKLKKLWNDLAVPYDERIATDKEVIEGRLISIGLGSEAYDDALIDGVVHAHERIQSLHLVVNEDGFRYVIRSFHTFHPKGTCGMEDDMYDDAEYKEVKLEEVDKTKIALSLF